MHTAAAFLSFSLLVLSALVVHVACTSHYESEQALYDVLDSAASGKDLAIMYTNAGYLDFAFNWLHYVNQTGVRNYLLVALDEEADSRLRAAGEKHVHLVHVPSTSYVPMGTIAFNVLTRVKLAFLYDVVRLGFNALLSDTDIVWFQNPFVFLPRDADISVQSEAQYGLDVGIGVSPRYCTGFMYVRSNERTVALLQRAVEIHAVSPHLDDQGVINTMFHSGLPEAEALNVHVLDPLFFPNGWVFFFRNAPQRRGLLPVLVHANWFMGNVQKRHMLRETLLWSVDPPTYYNPPGGLLTYEGCTPHGDPTLEGRRDTETCTLAEEEEVLTTALGVARVLNRTLILPSLACHQGDTSRQCRASHVWDIKALSEVFPIREHALLQNPHAPSMEDAVLLEGENNVQSWILATRGVPLVRLPTLTGASFADFFDREEAEAFRADVQRGLKYRGQLEFMGHTRIQEAEKTLGPSVTCIYANNAHPNSSSWRPRISLASATVWVLGGGPLPEFDPSSAQPRRTGRHHLFPSSYMQLGVPDHIVLDAIDVDACSRAKEFLWNDEAVDAWVRTVWRRRRDLGNLGTQVEESVTFESQLLENETHPSKMEITLHVFTMDRPSSLLRLLQSLSKADYGDTTLHLEVHVDRLPDMGAAAEEQWVAHKRVLDTLESFVWPYGEFDIEWKSTNCGVQGQWMSAWYPVSANQFALFLEDDMDVSRSFFLWIKEALRAYAPGGSKRDDKGSRNIYGISLQQQHGWISQTKQSFETVLGQHYENYLYKTGRTVQLPSTWGPLYFPVWWVDFRHWYASLQGKNIAPVQPYEPNAWETWLMLFAKLRNAFVVYSHFPDLFSLAINHQEAGLHYPTTAGPRNRLILEVLPSARSTMFLMPPVLRMRMFDIGGEPLL